MSASLAKSVTRARRGLTSGEVVVACAAGVVVVGASAVVVPRMVSASGDGEAVELRMPSDPERLSAVETVREFVRAGGAVAGVDEAGERVAFWYRDDRDEGYVNEDEIVVLSYREMLGAFTTARAVVASGAFSSRVDAGRLIGASPSSIWSVESDVATDVLAGGFDDVGLETSAGRPGAVTLMFRFNWASSGADGQYEESGFEVSLPTLVGWDGGP